METTAPIKVRQENLDQIERVPQATTPDQLLALAINKDLDIDKLAKLMELQKQYNDDLARKAFFSALSDFQINCPEIRKTKEVNFGQTKYFFAPLADIDRQIKKPLKDCGLSKRWEIKDTGEEIEVTCIITHLDGHSEQTGMKAKPDGSGSKNPIQARGSAIEYMKRYTLIGALGLTTTDTDMDGRLPEMDIDKLHKQYMDLYNQIVLKDESFRTPGDPDNWDVEKRTANLYVAAIGKARKILTTLTMKK